MHQFGCWSGNGTCDDKNAITAVHDVSNGGLAVALAEMVMAGDIGCEIDLSAILASDDIDDVDVLFSESHGRYLVTVSEDAVDDIMDKINVPVSIIGEVKGETLKLNDLELEINELNDAFYGVLEKYMVQLKVKWCVFAW